MGQLCDRLWLRGPRLLIKICFSKTNEICLSSSTKRAHDNRLSRLGRPAKLLGWRQRRVPCGCAGFGLQYVTRRVGVTPSRRVIPAHLPKICRVTRDKKSPLNGWDSPVLRFLSLPPGSARYRLVVVEPPVGRWSLKKLAISKKN